MTGERKRENVSTFHSKGYYEFLFSCTYSIFLIFNECKRPRIFYHDIYWRKTGRDRMLQTFSSRSNSCIYLRHHSTNSSVSFSFPIFMDLQKRLLQTLAKGKEKKREKTIVQESAYLSTYSSAYLSANLSAYSSFKRPTTAISLNQISSEERRTTYSEPAKIEKPWEGGRVGLFVCLFMSLVMLLCWFFGFPCGIFGSFLLLCF